MEEQEREVKLRILKDLTLGGGEKNPAGDSASDFYITGGGME